MKYAVNPKQWHDFYLWIAEDIFTMSTHAFRPENYKVTPLLYDGRPVYVMQGSTNGMYLDDLAERLRAHIPVERREKHLQNLIILYCQVMQEKSRVEK